MFREAESWFSPSELLPSVSEFPSSSSPWIGCILMSATNHIMSNQLPGVIANYVLWLTILIQASEHAMINQE